MSALNKNLLANVVGRIWAGLIGLVFIPLYIRYLGIEAYGLIGFFIVMQAWLVLLDMGMTPTLNREMARFSTGAHTPQSIRELLRSLEFVVITLGVLSGFVIWGASGWLASDWLRADELPVSTVAQAIAIMGGVAVLRLIEGIYRGALLGLQKQVFFNLAYSLIETVRAVGAIGILAWVSPSIEAYFVWQGLVSVAAVLVLAAATYRHLPPAELPVRFSRQALSGIRQFVMGMMAYMFLAVLQTQIDKILLSRLLSLQDFGYYSLAAAVAAALIVLINPITQAFFPRFSELVARGDDEQLVGNYHLAAQLVSTFAAPAALLLLLYGEDLLFFWSGDRGLAGQVAPILALLAVGTLLNCMMHVPFITQFAYGRLDITVKTNFTAVCVLVPAIYLATRHFGAIGAACVWASINAGYILVGMPFMYRHLLRNERWKWYRDDVLLPLSAASLAGGLFWYAGPHSLEEPMQLAWPLIAGLLMLGAAVAAAPALRAYLFRWALARRRQ